MYSLYACLILNGILGINPKNIFVEILPTLVTGTMANLLPSYYISLFDLYYGLMLPSGNDAACCLAFYYGCWLVTKKTFLGSSKLEKK